MPSSDYRPYRELLRESLLDFLRQPDAYEQYQALVKQCAARGEGSYPCLVSEDVQGNRLEFPFMVFNY